MNDEEYLKRFENPYPDGSDEAAHVETLIIRSADGTYERFAEQVAQANHCTSPLRLRGSIRNVDTATGKATTTYSTIHEPDGVILKSCGNRRESVCPPCASTYRADAREIVKSGLIGGKGMPESVSAHPTVFVTFTAPSFGTVHRGPVGGKKIPCHPANPGHTCKHGKSTACFARHDEDDTDVGTPICPECYDYEGAVLFNAMQTEVWRYTNMNLKRSLAHVLGLSEDEFKASYRLSYTKVVEYQRRGAVHVHAIIRVDGLDSDGDLMCPVAVTTAQLTQAVIAAKAKVKVRFPLRAKNRAIHARWGDQLDIKVINGQTSQATKKIVAYIAKYATKSAEPTGILDHRVKACDKRLDKLPAHSRRLVDTALKLAKNPKCAKLNLAAWANAYGFRGHWLTKSRHYSTTFTALHQIRVDYATARAKRSMSIDIHGPPESGESESHEIQRRFVYAGRGYRRRGDAVYAAQAARDHFEARGFMWEQIRQERDAEWSEIAA